MIVPLGLGDSYGDGVHRLQVQEGSGGLSGVVPGRNEDGDLLGPNSYGNAGRTHSMWRFRNISWSTWGGWLGQDSWPVKVFGDPGGKSGKPEPYRRDSLGEGWSMGRKDIPERKEPVAGGSGCSSSGRRGGGAGAGFTDKGLGKEEIFVEFLYHDGGLHPESRARKSVWGEI